MFLQPWCAGTAGKRAIADKLQVLDTLPFFVNLIIFVCSGENEYMAKLLCGLLNNGVGLSLMEQAMWLRH
ncbi:unnamed protein product [Urochloa humidicola]